MKGKIIGYVKEHIVPFLIASALLFVAHSWLVQHDAKLLADAAVKSADTQVDRLHKDTKVRVKALQKRAAEVKTPEEAVEAIPEVSALPLHPVKSLTAPGKVEVDAVPLYQNLNSCVQTGVKLGECKAELTIRETEIDQLKGKRGFWKSFGSAVKWTAILGGAGYVAGRLSK